MVDLKDDNLDLDTLIREQKLKKLRNKNSYMDAFLQRRKQAADFALEKRNASGYKYTKPQFYINDEKIIKNKKQNKYNNNINKLEDKTEFYKTYNTLKKNLIGKNNSINNIILIEKENNKYYLSQGIPKINNYDCNHNYKYSHYKTLNHHCCECCKHRNNEVKYKYSHNNNYNYSGKSTYNRNEYDDDFLSNEDINKKFNNIRHHSINLSTKNKNKNKNKIEQKAKGNKTNKNNIHPKNENYSSNNKNTFGNNLIIEKTGTNNFSNNYNTSKNKLKSLPNKNKNKDFYNININKYKNKSVQNTNSNIKSNANTNVISSIKKKDINNKDKDKDNSSNNIYYEGTDNHNFYDSNKMSNYIYNYEKYTIPNK